MAKANCAICGKSLIYHNEAHEVQCAICGKNDKGRCICADGHYVCDDCHRSAGIEMIIKTCATTGEKNPISLAQKLMNDQRIYPNGPEHHSLVGAVILAAYKNSGGDIDLVSALEELKARSLGVPGGTCGYWGCCGAAISAGQFYSIITSCTPLTVNEWQRNAKLTSDILGKLSDIGGPRCCKRTSFAAIEVTAEHVKENLGIEMELPESITFTFMAGNDQCRKEGCPYFPSTS